MYDYYKCEEKYGGAWLGMKIVMVDLIMYADKIQEYTPDDKIANRYSSIDTYFVRGCFNAVWNTNYANNNSALEFSYFLKYCFTKWTEEKFLMSSHVTQEQIQEWGVACFNTTEEGLEYNKDLTKVMMGSFDICMKNDPNATIQLKNKLDEFYKDQSIQFDSAVKSFFKNLFN